MKLISIAISIVFTAVAIGSPSFHVDSKWSATGSFVQVSPQHVYWGLLWPNAMQFDGSVGPAVGIQPMGSLSILNAVGLLGSFTYGPTLSVNLNVDGISYAQMFDFSVTRSGTSLYVSIMPGPGPRQILGFGLTPGTIETDFTVPALSRLSVSLWADFRGDYNDQCSPAAVPSPVGYTLVLVGASCAGAFSRLRLRSL